MKRLEFFLACGVSVLVSASVTFGQDTVSLRLNSPLVAPAPPGGAAVFPRPPSYSSVFEGGLTVRAWDSLLTSGTGWAMAATGRPGLNFDLPSSRLPFEVQLPWLNFAGSSVAVNHIKFAGRDGVPFPPIPPVPEENSFAVVVPEPSTWGLIGVGAAMLFHGCRRRR